MRNRVLISAIAVIWGVMASGAATALPAKEPLFLTAGVSPMVMLALSADHQLFIKAFGDFSDLNGDDVIDNTYVNSFDYYGYFDSDRCYQYNSGGGYFEPKNAAVGHHCSNAASSGDWSGNFLNWATMTRIDVLRKALYGGKRAVDTNAQTVLERALLPHDVHSFVKVFTPAGSDSIEDYMPTSFNVATTVSLCSSTPPPSSGSDKTQSMDTSTNQPKVRIANGDWGRWSADEVYQCEWRNNGVSPGTAQNLFGSGSSAPSVRVETCVAGKLAENCRTYDPTTAAKPIGLLQEYGEDGTLRFGLMSGSYDKRDKGGVLRKGISYLAGNTTSADDEVNLLDGTFNPAVNGIISTMNKIRLNTWDYSSRKYEDCSTYGISINTYLTSGASNRKCSNWGNPISELYLEAVRYLAGESSPTGTFNVASDSLGLPTASWTDPMPAVEACTPMNVVLLSSGDNSFDTDHLGSVPTALGSINSATDAIGVAEGIVSQPVFIGEVGAVPLANPDGNICSAKTLGNLSQARGLCPATPTKQGGFAIAGIAHKARTTDLRTDRDGDQTISTFAIAMAKNLPDFVFEVGSNQVTVVPNGYALFGGPTWPPVSDPNWRASSLAQVEVEETVYSGSTLVYARFLAHWEDSAWGNDYDMDVISRVSVCVAAECLNHDDDGDGSNDIDPGAGQLRVTTRAIHAASGAAMKVGFVISGTTADGEYTDLVKRTGGSHTSFDNDPLRDANEPAPTITEFTAGTSTASNLPSPLQLAAKYGGFRDVDDIDGLSDSTEWDSDADGLVDAFFFADDPSQIGPKLASFLSVISTTSSAASVVANSVSLQTTTRIYQAAFDSSDWSGSVKSFPVDVATGALLPAAWNAADLINAQDWDTGREWLTWDSTTGAGVPFRWADLNSIQQGLLNINPVSGTVDTLGSDRLDFLRGDSTNEQAGGSGTFRNRASVLGDVVHSTPTVVGAPNFGYRDTIEPAPYSAFKALYADVACEDSFGIPRAVGSLDREPILYFGGNDGALHGISACTGAERIAYVPSAVYPELSELTTLDYSHRYYVDGASTVVDAYFSTDSSWHTVLLGTLAAGGKGVFALDVTNPAIFSESSASQVVLWDKTPLDTGYGELGYTFSQPAIVKAQGHGWVAVFGNGYDGASGKAVLYVARIYDGALLATIDLSAAGPGSTLHGIGNGLSTVAPIDSDGDGDVDMIYGGDLNGNVWRFAANGSGFSRANTTLLYKAKNDVVGGDDQPITSRMSVGLHPTSPVGRIVYFGTGKYYEQADSDPLTAVQPNTMYGIWDRDTGVTVSSVVARNSNTLQQQTINTQVTSTFDGNAAEVRVLSNTPVTWALPGGLCSATGSCGWYLDLPDPGEKMVSNPILRGGRLIFVTTIPSPETCSGGGESWLMEIDPATGGRLDVSVFDLSGDGLFNASDMLGGTGIVSGVRSGVGIINTPAILAGIGGKGDGSYGGNEGKYASGSTDAKIEVTIENPGLLGAGRKSWVRTD